jgi:UDP-N-acetylglucosamine 2-epimerase (non-hydrolysing)
MKLAPVLHALAERGVRQHIVHTGQHYDVNMSDAIFRELRLPEPDVNLGVGSGSHAEQTAEILVGMERCLDDLRPDAALVYGDSNSTMAATLAASKAGIPVGHVEAGLRSDQRRTVSEVNRIVTDRLATWHFTPSADADENLLAEGTGPSSISRVGNVMIDTLTRLLPGARPHAILQMFGLMNGTGPKPYALVTLHTPANVDDEATLERILDALSDVAAQIPVIFPVHPRTRARMQDHQLQFAGLLLTGPLTYLQFLGLQRHATVVVTDSGGVQEETTYLGVPCLTVRENTDRPVTVRLGTNTVVGSDPARLSSLVSDVLGGRGKRGTIPPMWDGKAGERIADCLVGRL